MFRPLMALALFGLLLCAGLATLAFGAWVLAEIGANVLIYPFFGLGLLALFPLAFVTAGRLVLWIGGPVR